VSTLEMEVQSAATRFNLAWRSNFVQPQTDVTEVSLRGQAGNFEVKTVLSAGVFNNLNYNVENFCNCITLNLKVLLEGSYDSTTQLMRTILNRRGLLPGQLPIGIFGTPTAAGQPYTIAPWYYYGKESLSQYDSTIVDWVLVTVRSDSMSADSVVAQKAGLLHRDGVIEFLDKCWTLPFGKRYFVVVEHRNHLGVMSPSGQFLTNGSVFNHDFTMLDSYIWNNPISTGQKWVNGKWVLLTGDNRKNTFSSNFDINFLDRLYWKTQSGIFDAYQDSDLNMDADVNFIDGWFWKRNNGQYSRVQHK
jgi:hypothetical protein